MFKIGEFSKICLVSAKALRHWDEIGLLKPAHIDRDNSYRYYTIEQLYDVNRILALRAMGLSLTQVKEMLDSNVTAEEIRGMFLLRQAEIKQDIEMAEAKLRMLQARLSTIEKDDLLPDYEVALKSVKAQPALAIRETYPTVSLFADILLDINAEYAQPDWTYFAVFHDSDYSQEQMDVEVGFLIGSDAPSQITLDDERTMTPTELPAIEVATTVHCGSWMTLCEGYNALGRWINDNGYQIAGAGREIFHVIGRKVDPDDFVTELQFPIR